MNDKLVTLVKYDLEEQTHYHGVLDHNRCAVFQSPNHMLAEGSVIVWDLSGSSQCLFTKTKSECLSGQIYSKFLKH